MLLGLRGVGKTVLLNRIAEIAEAEGYQTMQLEAPEGQRLANHLAPALKAVLLRLSRVERAKDVATRAIGALRGFASAFKVTIGDLELGLSEPATADSGMIEVDMPELLLATARTASVAGQPVALFVDEVQYLNEEDLRALIVAIHRVGQRGLPLIVFGAGLPQLAALAGEARSYSERLFDFPPVGPLDEADDKRAVGEPIREEGAEIGDDALNSIVQETEGYPYFLQEWGKHAWDVAQRSPITLEDVPAASLAATAALDRSFFRVRFDRLTPRERTYLRAMSELGPGPHRSGDIAETLDVEVSSVAPLRSALIRKGMIYSPAHGDTAFTVPMFDQFMRRIIPKWEPPAERRRRAASHEPGE